MRALIVILALVAGCGRGSDVADGGVGGVGASSDGAVDLSAADDGAVAMPDAAADGAVAGPPCTTRVTYGATWIHGAGHPAQDDVAAGAVTWDGSCTDDGANSYAVLSNGWKPYFSGNGACMLALDTSACATTPACATRVTYGAAWLHGPNHVAQYDDVAGRVTWDGVCRASGSDGAATLSNGWTPTFSGASACELSFEYRGCGGLYGNPVVDVDCPDPGVLFDGKQYLMTCTSGDAANAFPIRTSTDLASWTQAGSVFPSGKHPSWAASDFWAAEIHEVGAGYVVYFTARDTDGMLSIGAASATSPTGPFTDLGKPLLHDASMGLIDPSEIEAPDGTRYVLWKEDGNAVGKPTPIHAQKLAPDGLSVVGAAATLITNDQAWEGPLVEGPFMFYRNGTYYLFYSGNAYNSTAYAIGVARGSSPMGPFTKLPQPIVISDAAWGGPGHCSVVATPDGETEVIYHAWVGGSVGAAPGRLALVDRIVWTADGWPSVPGAPSSRSQPMP